MSLFICSNSSLVISPLAYLLFTYHRTRNIPVPFVRSCPDCTEAAHIKTKREEILPLERTGREGSQAFPAVSNSGERWIAGSKVEDLGFGSQIDQMRSAGQGHVREKLRLVNLTSVCAGRSDAYKHFMFH